MPSSDEPTGRDPMDRMSEPAKPEEAAGYLIEMLASMAHFAHISDLQNSSVILAAASKVVDQECRLRTDRAPILTTDTPVEWPFPFDKKD